MKDINPATQKVLGWTLGGVSLFHASVLMWGVATWSQRLLEDLEVEFGELAPYVLDNLESRGAPIEFLMGVLAALACVGWVLVARWGYAPAFLRGWKGRPALLGGGTVVLAYLVAAVMPLLVILDPHELERIPSWDALGAGGDATFLGAFLIDAIAVAWWTLDRSRQSTKR